MAKTIAAGIFLVNKEGYILICHPTNHAADFWSIPTGKVEEGESLVDAAIRETFEETNIDLSECSGLKAMDAVTYTHKKKVLNPFIAWEPQNKEVDWSAFDIKCNSNVPEDRGGFPEMDGYKWVSIEEARILLHSLQATCLDKVKAYIDGHS